MTDLSKGIIEIDGFEISPATTREDLITAFGEKISPIASTNQSIYCMKTFNIDGHKFMVRPFMKRRTFRDSGPNSSYQL